MLQEIKIHGASLSRGETDNGIKYDFAKVYILAPMDSSKGTKIGSAGIELRCKSECYDTLKNQVFPLTCKIEMGMEASGKGEFKQIVVNVELIKTDFNNVKKVG
jgi:hypothetical protein